MVMAVGVGMTVTQVTVGMFMLVGMFMVMMMAGKVAAAGGTHGETSRIGLMSQSYRGG